jgi:hypothetical protein
MFGLSLTPTTFNIKPSSGWKFSNSFSRISFTWNDFAGACNGATNTTNKAIVAAM